METCIFFIDQKYLFWEPHNADFQAMKQQPGSIIFSNTSGMTLPEGKLTTFCSRGGHSISVATEAAKLRLLI